MLNDIFDKEAVWWKWGDMQAHSKSMQVLYELVHFYKCQMIDVIETGWHKVTNALELRSQG